MEMKNKWIVFYDGECAMCHFAVSFALARDVRQSLYFSPLIGETAIQVLGVDIQSKFGDSIIVTFDGDVYTYSDAIVQILYQLKSPWHLIGKALILFPKSVRDFVYKRVAAIRKKYFQKPIDICPVLSPEVRERFLK